MVEVESLGDFVEAVKVGKLALAPFCDTSDCETNIKSKYIPPSNYYNVRFNVLI